MPARSAALLLLLMLCGAAPGDRIVGDFSHADDPLPEGVPPEGWETLEFPKIPKHTRYALERDGDVSVVHARSEDSASGWIRRVEIDLEKHPIVSWRWKVSRVLERGDVTLKGGDDAPARLYVNFKYEPERVGLWRRAQYLAVRAVYGELPIAALVYLWGSRADQTGSFDSPYSGSFVKLIPVERGAEHVGEWRSETRNVYDDYRRAFGEEPPLVEGVAIMTDTDDTGESAEAWYGDIVFSSELPR
jgi:hypothetical protein